MNGIDIVILHFLIIISVEINKMTTVSTYV